MTSIPTTLEQISCYQAGRHHLRWARSERVQYFSLTRISSCVAVAPCRATCTDTMYAATNTQNSFIRICFYSCDLGYPMQNCTRLWLTFIASKPETKYKFPSAQCQRVCVCFFLGGGVTNYRSPAVWKGAGCPIVLLCSIRMLSWLRADLSCWRPLQPAVILLTTPSALFHLPARSCWAAPKIFLPGTQPSLGPASAAVWPHGL
jgi:hypothetical protein